MALSTFNIQIEKPVALLADTMNSIRSWLDSHKIQPIEFKSRSTEGAIVCEIAFKAEDEAHLFAREFRTLDDQSNRLGG